MNFCRQVIFPVKSNILLLWESCETGLSTGEISVARRFSEASDYPVKLNIFLLLKPRETGLSPGEFLSAGDFQSPGDFPTQV